VIAFIICVCVFSEANKDGSCSFGCSDFFDSQGFHTYQWQSRWLNQDLGPQKDAAAL